MQLVARIKLKDGSLRAYPDEMYFYKSLAESLKLHFSHPGVLLRDGLQPISAHGSPSLLRDGLHSAHFGCPSLLRDGLHSAHLDSPSLLRDGLQPISALLTAARWAPFGSSRLSFTAA